MKEYNLIFKYINFKQSQTFFGEFIINYQAFFLPFFFLMNH